MAILVDVTSPIRWSSTLTNGGSIVSASFTAPADSLLVVVLGGDGETAAYGTITHVVTDSGGLAWTKQVERLTNETTDAATAAIWTAWQAGSDSRTITVTHTHSLQGAVALRVSAKAYVLTGVDEVTSVDVVTASNEGGSSANPTDTTSLTPGANGLLFVGCSNWAAQDYDASSDLIEDVATYVGFVSMQSGYRECISGVSVTGNINPAAGTPHLKWCTVIVRESPTAPEPAQVYPFAFPQRVG